LGKVYDVDDEASAFVESYGEKSGLGNGAAASELIRSTLNQSGNELT